MSNREIEEELRLSVRKATAAAYRLGRRPKDRRSHQEAKSAFEAAVRSASLSLSRVREETSRTDYYGRLRVLRDAVSRPEADPASPEHAGWLAAVRYFAGELGMPFPPSTRDNEHDKNWAKGLAPSR